MAKTRSSIFDDGDDSADLDLGAFAPKAAPDTAAPPLDQVRAVSEASRFPSRESKPRPPRAPKAAPVVAAPTPAVASEPLSAPREQRRHRTGRNVQLNMKVRQEDVDTLLAIGAAQKWVQGEVLEHALAALQRELAAGKGRG